MIEYHYDAKRDLWRWVDADHPNHRGTCLTLDEAIEQARGELLSRRKPNVQAETNRIERSKP